ncbi:UNVERIFIED_CONTAM: hypothetical protein K2H54_037793 [Gekko kuhli]
MRVAAWEALGKMDLLDDKDVVQLAKALMDDNTRVRDLARSLLDSVAGITDKFVLKKEMQRLAKCSLEDLKKMEEPSKTDFPRRLRTAGIIAESSGDAVNALIELSEKLMSRVDKRLTANLFLMTERPLEESPEQDSRSPPSRRKLGSMAPAPEEAAQAAAPEAHVEAKARWLGLFDSAPQQTAAAKSPGAIAIEAARRQQMQKVPKTPSSRKESVSAELLGRELLSESGSSAGSSSSSGSSSTWREVRREKRRMKEKGQLLPQLGAMATRSPPPEGPKPTKSARLTQPVTLQRKDTRTQLYSEMLKHQQAKKEQALLAPPPAPKQDSGGPPGKAGQAPAPGAPPEAPKGSLIDPNQEYSLDKTKWRSDLYKLLMLRIAPSVEGRTATEDLLASARVALGGRAMSWDLFATISQSILSAQDKITPEPAQMKKYMAELFKSSPWELWPERAEESKETVVAVRTGREIGTSVGSESESSILEERPRIKDEDGEEEEEAVAEKAAAEKKRKADLHGKLKKAAVSVAQRKKVARAEKKEGPGEGGGEDEEEVSRKEGEAVRKKERELVKGKEQELAREKEQELAGEKEQEAAQGKEREKGKRRKWEAAVRKEREMAQKAMRRAERRGTGAEEAVEELGKEDKGVVSEERIPASTVQSELSEAMGWSLTDAQDSIMLAELKERILAEAEEIALAELREEALAEAQERLLEEMREQALAETRKNTLAELREKALAEARERVLAEMRESALAEARERVLSEVMERALAEAREMALAEGAEGELYEERVRELAAERVRELVEERMRELTLTWSMEVDEARIAELAEARVAEQAEAQIAELAKATEEELAEAKVAELTKAKIAELAEAKIAKLVEAKMAELVEAKMAELVEAKVAELAEAKMAELAEAKVAELAEAKVAELAEAKVAELAEAEVAELDEAKAEALAEARVWELVKTKIKDLAKVKAKKRAEAKMRELGLAEAAQWDEGPPGPLPEEEEAETLEDVGGDEVMIFSEEEREALMSTLLEERAGRQELGCLDQALLLLDILTKPEVLGGSDPQVFQRLFQVVSLLQIPSGLHYKQLAEYLLQSADEVAKAGEEEDRRSAKEVSPIYRELRRAVEAHRPESGSSWEFAARMRALLRAAQLMVRARALKEQLEKGCREHPWWAKAEKEWMEDEKRVVGRRDWVDQRLREAICKWQAEQKTVELEKQEERYRKLRLQLRPGQLREDQWEGRGERKEERPEAEREEQALGRVGQPPGLLQPKKITWSLSQWQHRARETVLKLEEMYPARAKEHDRGAPGPKMQRLPRGLLYLPTKLPPIGGPQVRRGVRQHVLRSPERATDWEMFSSLYQSLLLLREEEGGVESPAWREQLCALLDLFGLSNRLIRALVQQLVAGEGSPRGRALTGKDFPMGLVEEANLGERILFQVAHRLGPVLPKPPAWHGVVPLSYRNDVHPFRTAGVAHFGTLSLKWRTFFHRGRLPSLRLCIQPQPLSK